MGALPSSGIPWTEVAKLMDNERYPLDYNRRWTLIKRNHETGALVIAATARTGASTMSQEERVALSSPVPRAREDFGRKRVAVLKDLLMRCVLPVRTSGVLVWGLTLVAHVLLRGLCAGSPRCGTSPR